MIKAVFVLVATLAFGYLCGAFVQVEIDFRLWSVGARFITLMLSIACVFFVEIVIAMASSDYGSRKRTVIRGKAERV